MGIVFINDPNLGYARPFQVAGDSPSETEWARIRASLTPAAPEPEAVDTSNLPGTAIGRGLQYAGSTAQSSLGEAVEGFGRQFGFEGIQGLGADWASSAEEARAAEVEETPLTPWEDVDSLGSLLSFGGEQLGQSAGVTGAGIAGALIGAAAVPAAPIAAPIIGSAAMTLPFLYGENRAEQKAEDIAAGREVDVEEGKAFFTAIPQAVLGAVADRVMLRLTRVLPRGSTLPGRIGRGITEGAAAEGSTEVLQEAMQIWQAGGDPTSDAAVDRYLQALAGAGVAGGAIGGVAGGIQSAPRDDRPDKNKELQEDLDADEAAALAEIEAAEAARVGRATAPRPGERTKAFTAPFEEEVTAEPAKPDSGQQFGFGMDFESIAERRKERLAAKEQAAQEEKKASDFSFESQRQDGDVTPLFTSQRERVEFRRPDKTPAFTSTRKTDADFISPRKAEEDAVSKELFKTSRTEPLTLKELPKPPAPTKPDDPGTSYYRTRIAERAEAATAAPVVPEVRVKVPEIETALRKELSGWNMDNDVEVVLKNVIDSLAGAKDVITEGMESSGADGKRLITLALDTIDPGLKGEQLTKRLLSVLRHEGLHSMRRLGMVSDSEMAKLVRAASGRNYTNREGKKRSYSYLGRAIAQNERLPADMRAGKEQVMEEAVAEMFRDAADGKFKIGGPPKGVIDRIIRFLKAIATAGRSVNLNSADQIFGSIMEGKVYPKKGITREQRQGAEIFYSPLLRAVEGHKTSKARPSDWKNIIGNSPGVKPVERDWLGIDEFLDMLPQDQSVSREDIADFVRESQLQITESIGSDKAGEWRMHEGDWIEEDPEYIAERAEEMATQQLLEEKVREYEARSELAVDYFPGMEPRKPTADDLDPEEVEALATEIKTNLDANPTEREVTLFHEMTDEIHDGVYDDRDDTFFFPSLRNEPFANYDEVMEYARDQLGDGDFLPFHEQYTEDGGKNYREMLLRVPNLHEIGPNRPPQDLTPAEQADYKRIMQMPDGPDRRSMLEHFLGHRKVRQQREGKLPFVEEAHYPQKNAVMTARLKDRLGVDGSNHLFSEEQQSDLASAHRKMITQEEHDKKIAEEQKKIDDADRKTQQAEKALVNVIEKEAPKFKIRPDRSEIPIPLVDYIPDYMSHSPGESHYAAHVLWVMDNARKLTKKELESYKNPAVVAEHTTIGRVMLARSKSVREAAEPWMEASVEQAQVASASNKRIKNLIDRLYTSDRNKRLPDTPWKDVNAYTLMMKRLLREAAEKGYDYLSWTPAYMQTRRWDSKAADAVQDIRWAREKNRTTYWWQDEPTEGETRVILTLMNGQDTILDVDTEGDVIEASHPASEKIVPGTPISKLFGPKVAKQIMEEDSGNMDGANISFPGGGYKIAYDQQSHTWISKFVKKYGSKVEEYRGLEDFGGEAVWAIKITPELRAAAMQPMAILRKPAVQPDTAKPKASKSAVEALLPEFRKQLDALGLKRVDLGMLADKGAEGPQGEFQVDLSGNMKILIGASQDPQATLNHEVVHALMAMDLFTQNEMNTLQSVARRDWMKKYDIRARYKGEGKMLQLEEAIAEAFADYMKNPKKVSFGPVKTAFEKIKKFFNALRSAIGAMPPATVDQIFEGIASGKVGRKAASGVAGGESYSRMQVAQKKNVQHLLDLDKTGDGILYGRFYDLLEKGLGKVMPKTWASKVSHEFVTKFQDEMVYVGKIVDDLRSKGAKDIDILDIYRKEELLHGEQGDRIRVAEEKLFKPVIDRIAQMHLDQGEVERLMDIKGLYGEGYAAKKINEYREPEKSTAVRVIKKAFGFGKADRLAVADVYLYARHAPERNRYVNRISKGDNRNGSGMSDAEANAIMKWVDSLSPEQQQVFKDIGTLVDNVVEGTNKTYIQFGLMPDKGVVTVSYDQEGDLLTVKGKAFKWYVPLRGKDGDAPQDQSGMPNSDPALGAYGKENPNIVGRSSGYAANSILADVLTQHQRAIVRGGRNSVGESFAQLIEKNPEMLPDYKVLDKLPSRKVKVTRGDKTWTAVVPDHTAFRNPNILPFKRDGKQMYVEGPMSDTRVMKALRGSGNPQSSKAWIRGLSNVNRYLASINTSWNPEFLITNLMRDVQQAGVNLTQYEIDGLRTDMLKSMWDNGKVLKRFYRDGERHDTSGAEDIRVFEEFLANGGKNMTNMMQDTSGQEGEIKRVLSTISDIGGTAVDTEAMFLGKGAKGVKSLAKYISDYNDIVENTTRFSLYKALRKRGVSPEQSAQAARNLTTNFTKGGEWKTGLNAMYLFYNASLQGSMAMLNAGLRSKKVQQVWMGAIGLGILMDQMAALLSPEDDDERLVFDKISDYTLEHNLIFMDPFGLTERGYFTIPLPYGMNVFVNAGRAASRAARQVDRNPVEEATRSLGSTALETLNPFGDTESLTNMIAPTILDFPIDVLDNRDFRDAPITKEPYPGDKSAVSGHYWTSTSPTFVKFSNVMNKATGGTDIEPGLIDWSPDIVEHFFDFITGGMGATIKRVMELPVTLAEFEEESIRQVPFVRRLYGSATVRGDTADFSEGIKQINLARQELKDARDKKDEPRIESAKKRHAVALRIYPRVNALANMRKKQMEMRNKIIENTTMSDAEKKKRLKVIDDRIKKILDEGNELMLGL